MDRLLLSKIVDLDFVGIIPWIVMPSEERARREQYNKSPKVLDQSPLESFLKRAFALEEVSLMGPG